MARDGLHAPEGGLALEARSAQELRQRLAQFHFVQEGLEAIRREQAPDAPPSPVEAGTASARHAEELANIRANLLKLQRLHGRPSSVGPPGASSDASLRGQGASSGAIPRGSSQPPSARPPGESEPSPPAAACEEVSRAAAEIERAVTLLSRTCFEGDHVLAVPTLRRGAATAALLAPAVVLKVDGVRGEVVLRFDGDQGRAGEGDDEGAPVPVSRVMKNDIRCAFAGITRRLVLGRWASDEGEGQTHEVFVDDVGKYLCRSSDQPDNLQPVDRQRWGLFLGGTWQLDEARSLPEQLEWLRGRERQIWRRI